MLNGRSFNLIPNVDENVFTICNNLKPFIYQNICDFIPLFYPVFYKIVLDQDPKTDIRLIYTKRIYSVSPQ